MMRWAPSQKPVRQLRVQLLPAKAHLHPENPRRSAAQGVQHGGYKHLHLLVACDFVFSRLQQAIEFA
jgi:hypothetical protein